MRQDWTDYERVAERSPLALGIKIVIGVALLSGLITIFGWIFGLANETAAVADKELGPAALLKKYEWFKDASAALDKKQADIAVYQTRITSLEQAYKGMQRAQWPRDEREQMSIWQSEAAGVKASYNSLAAEYNAQMAKINWRFANIGYLPQGAAPLPREYRTYSTE